VAGDQPPNGLAEPSQIAAFGQRTVSAGLEIKHWTSPQGGILAGVVVARLNDQLSGDLLYVQRGVTLGIFRNIGPALP
jgi:hypothetical protein